MRLAFCIFHYFPYGGLQKDFMTILKACSSRGHHIDVYTMEWTGSIPENINLYCLPQKALTNHRRAQKFSERLQKIFDQKNSYYHKIIGFNKMAGLDIYFAGDHCFIKKVSCYKRLLPRYKTYFRMEKAVFNSKAPTRILALTEQQRQDFRVYYHTPETRFFLLPPSIDPEFKNFDHYFKQRSRLRAELGLYSTDKMILVIAGYFKTKGLDRTLKALAFLNSTVLKTRAHLFIIGGDNDRPYWRFIKKAGLEKHVHFLGAQKNVVPFYASADIFLHPAYQEAGGKVLIEAMAAGLPVLTTDICGYSGHIAAAKAGKVLSSPYQQSECNQGLFSLLCQSSEELKNLRQNAQEYSILQNIYSLGETVADFIEKYT